MGLQDTIKDDMKTAMKAKDSARVTTLRGVMSSFTNELVSQGKTPQDALTDDEALAVIKREAKKRKDAIDQFEQAGRSELAADERAELDVLETYLPELMSVEALRPIVKKAIADTGATSKADMGNVMSAVMKEVGGSADGNDVRSLVEELLA